MCCGGFCTQADEFSGAPARVSQSIETFEISTPPELTYLAGVVGNGSRFRSRSILWEKPTGQSNFLYNGLP